MSIIYDIHIHTVMTVQLISDSIMVLENQPIQISVNVTVFGSLTRNLSVVLHYGEGGASMNYLIDRTNGTQTLQIPSTGQLNCTSSVIQVSVTTNDPLIELRGNQVISVHIGKTICTYLKI